MASRAKDWREQADCDLALAQTACDSGSHEWACFVSQQAAEKGVKAMHLHLGGDAWGHALVKLLDELPHDIAAPEKILDAGRRLDKFYTPTRYPNGFAAGKPADYFTKEDSHGAIADAERILAWVDELVR